MRTLVGLTVLAALLAPISARATLELAHSVPPSEIAPVHIPGSANPSDAAVAAAAGVPLDSLGRFLWKWDVAGDNPAEESGVLASSYSVDPDNGDLPTVWTGDGGVTIRWDGGSSAANPTYILAKDGIGGTWVWNLVGQWDGMEDIHISELMFPVEHKGVLSLKVKDISHIELGGALGIVPEPSTVIAGLLLLAPLGMGIAKMFNPRRTTKS